MLSIILSCVTEVPVRHGRGGGGGGGSVIAAFFLAHNYLSEQFGNYVEYGTFSRMTEYATTTTSYSYDIPPWRKAVLF